MMHGIDCCDCASHLLLKPRNRNNISHNAVLGKGHGWSMIRRYHSNPQVVGNSRGLAEGNEGAKVLRWEPNNDLVGSKSQCQAYGFRECVPDG